MVEVALRCVYACPRTDQWTMADSLFHVIEAATRDASSRGRLSERWQRLVDEADRLDAYLEAAEQFAATGVPLPLAAFRDVGSDAAAQLALLRCWLADGFPHATISADQWQKTVDMFRAVHAAAFSLVPLGAAHALLARRLLVDGGSFHTHANARSAPRARD